MLTKASTEDVTKRLHRYEILGFQLSTSAPLAFQGLKGEKPSLQPLLLQCSADLSRRIERSALGVCVHRVTSGPTQSLLTLWRRECTEGLAKWTLLHGGWCFELDLAQETILFSTLNTSPEFPLPIVLERVLLPLVALLSSQKSLAFHASGCALNKRGWLFTGLSGAGKSTTAFELARRHRDTLLLADDLALLEAEDSLLIRPSSVSTRLWRASLQDNLSTAHFSLPNSPLSSPPHPSEQATKREALQSKHWFRLQDQLIATQKTPLVGFVVLSPSEEAPQNGSLKRLRGQEAVSLLLSQCFDFTNPPRRWSLNRFRGCCQIAREVPIYRYSFCKSTSGNPNHITPLNNALRALGST